MKFLKQSTYIRYLITKLSKLVQISMLTSSDSLDKGFFENYKGSGTSFQATFFVKLFDKKFYFVTMHKLAKFHYQTVITSGWAFDDVMTFEYLKFIISRKILLSQERKELSKRNKKHFFLLHKYSLLHIQNKLAKM